MEHASEGNSIATSGPAQNDVVKLASLLFSSYLIAAPYRYYFRTFSSTVQYCYITLSGLILMFCGYGFDVYHSLICVFLVYAILKCLPGTLISVVVIFTFLMGYLLIGYKSAYSEYDLGWILPQCILTLRLIGLAWDVYDGQNARSDHRHQQTALHDPPDLLEVMAYTYFFGSFLVGPLYPLRRLRSLVSGDFNDPTTGDARGSLSPCLQRLGLGLFYAAVYFTFYPMLPTEFFLTAQFKTENVLWKSVHLCLWLRFILCRYFAVWLVAEGCCILTGLAYNGQNADTDDELWDGVRNVRLTKFELGSSFQSIIDSFNYNTNQWASRYVFKRLKFLGSKSLSHFSTLMFLALWHGLHSGYFACFFFEYICVVAERQANGLLSHLPQIQRLLNTDKVFNPVWFVKKAIVTYGCAYGLLPFALLKIQLWWQVYTDFNFAGHLVYGVAWQAFFVLASYSLTQQNRHIHHH